MDDGRFHTATAETKLQHPELFRASVGAPANSPVALIASLLLPTTPVRGESPACARKPKRNLDSDKWFNNVEIGTAEKVSIESTTYVRNIFKYYTAYKLMLDHEESQKRRVKWFSGPAKKPRRQRERRLKTRDC
jgi:hypothetical protein